MKVNAFNQSASERIFDVCIKLILILLTIFFLYPFYNSVVLSFNDGGDARNAGIYFWPRVFTLQNYKYVLGIPDFLQAAFMTVARTLVGTVVSILVTAMYGFAVSKRELIFRKFYIVIGVITMYFGGGLIPFYIVIKQLHLYNNFLVYVLPGAFSMFNVIIFMSFFRSLSPSLDESAKIDGASYITIFFRIILPVSTPVVAAISIFVAVSAWNSWFDTMIFTKSPLLRTMAFFFVRVVQTQQFYDRVTSIMGGAAGQTVNQGNNYTGQSLQLAAMVISTFPIIVIYPFLQKYFVKGIMIGSVKG